MDHYRYITDLNKGSYGVVALYEDTRTGAHVAIKCISGSATSAVDEARQEVAMHMRLGSHRYISKLLDHFEQDSKTYLVMEYHSGGDLYEAIRAGRGPRDQGSVYEFMCQLIEAVEFCHARGVYHRDIKPENILISAKGNVKLADFGLAACTRRCSDFGVGSERYMAPEVFDSATDTYDARQADVWSVGIVLLNIVFGRNPFSAATQKDKLFMDFASSREALYDVFPTLTSDLFAVLRHSLTMDPDNRSLSQMRRELDKVRLWTTDDLADDLANDLVNSLDDLQDFSDDVVEDAADDFDLAAGLDDLVITATTDRLPLRTPTVVDSYRPEPVDMHWDRTMQFTPPARPSFMRAHPPSQLSQSYSRYEVETEPVDSGELSEASDKSDDKSDKSDDDMFVMDGFRPQINLRTASSDSAGSAPSLVTSDPLSTNPSRPTSVRPGRPSMLSLALSPKPIAKMSASVPANRDFWKFGQSWSDMADEDDDWFDPVYSSSVYQERSVGIRS